MRAFTLIELIFVIVIIGTMTAVGFSSFKPKHLINDVNFIKAKIQEAQFLGLGYEHNDFGGGGGDANLTSGCIEIKESSLEENATNRNEVNYKLHVEIKIDDETDYDSDNSPTEVLCFDSKGRPHHTDFTTATLLTQQKVFSFKYSEKERHISIQPITGYAIITY